MDQRTTDIVLVRMDKIGDLIVSLPVDEHPAFAGQRIHWFITQGLGFITDQAAPKRQATEFKRRFNPFEFWRMYQWFKTHNPLTVVLLHNPWWVSMAAWLAGVPERIGRRSQWHTWLSLNVPIQQKRSASDRHESDFNFDLVEWGYNRLGLRRTVNLSALKRTFLRLLAPNPFGTLGARDLKSRGYRVVHPGMAGSALNWPQEFYFELIKKLAQEMPVVITGTKADRKYLAKLEVLKGDPQIVWLVEKLKVYELLDLLSQAKSVTGPSTGVLHLAAALGTPTIGIYSPRRVEHPRRWGPKGLATAVLVPPVQEAELFQPEVMKQILPETVYETVIGLEQGHVIKSKEAPKYV